MRRVGVFITVGPVLTLVIIMLMCLDVKMRFPAFHDSGFFLLFAFTASLLPPIGAGLMDILVLNKTWKIWVTACAGAAVALSELMFVHGLATPVRMAEFCTAGAIPAAVCSWVSERWEGRS